MRIFYKLQFLITALATTIMVACNNAHTDEPVNNELSITFEMTELTLSGDGGTQSIGYTIINGINGIDIVLETDASWIKNLHTEESRIIFDYEKNFSNGERDALIAVRYPNYSTQTIKVKQVSSDALTFEIEITNMTSTSCTTNLVPSDSKTPYIVYMAEVSYLSLAEITNEVELFEDDYRTYTQWASDYGAQNLEEFMYQAEIAFQGNSTVTWTSMVPDREYVLYAYAIEFSEDGQDYTLASAVTYEIVTLPSQVFSDIEFDVKITVDGPRATYEFEPIDWDGKYYLEIFAEGDPMYLREDETPTNDYYKMLANNWISLITFYMQSGYTAENLMEIMCLQGPDSYSEIREANTNYCMVFYGIEMVDGLPQVTTKPYFAHFRTEEVKPSDMQIDIKVENCYVRVADVTITPSNNEEQYIATFLKKSDVPHTENQDIIDWLLSYNLSGFTYKGTVQSRISSLEPDTEYIALAFGYYGGVVTTDLFRYEFKTEPESECQNEVLGVNITGPYSLLALETAMPDVFFQYGMFESMGWYAMCAEIVTENPDGYVFMNTYTVEELVTSDMDWVKSDVVSYVSDRSCLFVGENDKLYVMCAVTMDYKGNYSEMWISDPFSFTFANGTRDINELLEKLGYTAQTQAEPTIKMLSL